MCLARGVFGLLQAGRVDAVSRSPLDRLRPRGPEIGLTGVTGYPSPVLPYRGAASSRPLRANDGRCRLSPTSVFSRRCRVGMTTWWKGVVCFTSFPQIFPCGIRGTLADTVSARRSRTGTLLALWGWDLPPQSKCAVDPHVIPALPGGRASGAIHAKGGAKLNVVTEGHSPGSLT